MEEREEGGQFGCKRKESKAWVGGGWPAAGMTKYQSERGGLPSGRGEAPQSEKNHGGGGGRKGLDSGTAVPVSQERNESSRVQSCPTTGREAGKSQNRAGVLSRRGEVSHTSQRGWESRTSQKGRCPTPVRGVGVQH